MFDHKAMRHPWEWHGRGDERVRCRHARTRDLDLVGLHLTVLPGGHGAGRLAGAPVRRHVEWLAFDLHPEYPPEGIPRADLVARYGERP